MRLGKKITVMFGVCLMLVLAAKNLAQAEVPISPNKYVRHFVAFKYKPGTTQQQIDDIVSAFAALKDSIPGIVTFEYGPNNSPEALNLGMADGFLLTFEAESDRDEYLVHPEHNKFKALALPFVEQAFVLDFASTGVKPRSAPQEKTDAFQSQFSEVVDLTHVLSSGLPDFHNDANAFQYKMLFTFEKDGYADGQFTTPEHYGTHIDAPYHFCKTAKTIDQVPPAKLILPCVVLDVREDVKGNPDYRLTVEKVKAFEAEGAIPDGAVVMLNTGWASRWDKPASYRNADAKSGMHFPGFGAEAVDYLMKKRHVVALGVDTLSADYGQSHDFPVHGMTLPNDVLLIENLANLDQMPARNALVFLGPLRIKGGSGSPARILGFVP